MSKGTARQPHQFQPGDRVIWWKRIPGGPYVYSIKVTVLAVTAKQVKVAGDDDGIYVTRFVPPESLQLQNEPLFSTSAASRLSANTALQLTASRARSLTF